MAFPANVDSGRIVGRFIFGVVDGPDADEEPDFAAAVGTITFTPSVKYIPVHGTVEEPFVLVPATITGVLDENGYLCTPNPDDPLMAGYRGIKMVATDDPNFLVQDWTWQVTYKLESRPDAPASIPPHSITVPGGSIQDLSILTQVPSNPGYGLPHAEAAARRAEAAAQSVVDRADSGEFNGTSGADGSNVLPTAEAITRAISPGGAAEPSLKAAIAEKVSIFEADATTTASEVTDWLAIPYDGMKRLVGNLKVTEPVIIRSNTVLDVTGAKITCGAYDNMLQNVASAPIREGAADSNVTSGSTTVESVSANFTQADVGRALSVSHDDQERGANVYGRIASVTSSTSAVVDSAPLFSGTAGVAKVYGRDENIRIIGGNWDRGDYGGQGNQSHSIFLRRIDNVSVSGINYKSKAGKYAVAFGDCTNVRVDTHHVDAFSDAMHFTGPCANVVVDGVTGVAGDDSVPFTTTDYGSYNDCHGDITNVSISNISSVSPMRTILLATSATEYPDGHSIRGVRMRNVETTKMAVYTEVLADDPNSRIDDISLVDSVGDVQLKHVLHGQVVIENLTGQVTLKPDAKHTTGAKNLTNHVETLIMRDVRNSVGSALVLQSGESTIGELEVTGGGTTNMTFACKSIGSATFESTSVPFYTVRSGAQIEQLTFRNCKMGPPTVVPMGMILGSSSVGTIVFEGGTYSAPTTNAGNMVEIQNGSTVGQVKILLASVKGLRSLLQNNSADQVRVQMMNTAFDGCNRIIQGSGGAIVSYSNVNHISGLNTPLFADGPLTLAGVAFTSPNTTNAFDRPASQSIRVQDPNLRGDVSKLDKSNGDAAFNTNGALSCGTGPAVTDGNNWKNTFSGATD